MRRTDDAGGWDPQQMHASEWSIYTPRTTFVSSPSADYTTSQLVSDTCAIALAVLNSLVLLLCPAQLSGSPAVPAGTGRSTSCGTPRGVLLSTRRLPGARWPCMTSFQRPGADTSVAVVVLAGLQRKVHCAGAGRALHHGCCCCGGRDGRPRRRRCSHHASPGFTVPPAAGGMGPHLYWRGLN
jgi:hypothetical protein